MKATSTLAAVAGFLTSAHAQCYSLTAARSGSLIHLSPIQARGFGLWIGGGPSVHYCPTQIERLGDCPNTQITNVRALPRESKLDSTLTILAVCRWTRHPRHGYHCPRRSASLRRPQVRRHRLHHGSLRDNAKWLDHDRLDAQRERVLRHPGLGERVAGLQHDRRRTVAGLWCHRRCHTTG